MLTRIFEYVKKKYGVLPEYLWVSTPENGALRNSRNGKWFGVFISNLSKKKLGLESDEKVTVLNLKCDPMLTFSFVDNVRIFRGYHMNKEHWISVLMDGSVLFEELCALVDMSYQIIDGK